MPEMVCSVFMGVFPLISNYLLENFRNLTYYTLVLNDDKSLDKDF